MRLRKVNCFCSISTENTVRGNNLCLIAYDGTFLILPWVRIRSLASRLLPSLPLRFRRKGRLLRIEAEILGAMRLALFDDLEALPESEPPMIVVQLIGFSGVSTVSLDKEREVDDNV